MHVVGTPDSDDVSSRGSPLNSRSNVGAGTPPDPLMFIEPQQQKQQNNEHNHRHDLGDHGCLSFNVPSAAKMPSMLAVSMSTSSIGSSWSNELACLRQTGHRC
jgi:hypothetical protein